MKNRTINQAIIDILKKEGKPLTVKDIYENIIKYDYYRFKAENPPDIVRIQIRRHCINLDFPTASDTKYFQIFPDGTYYLKDEFPGNLKPNLMEIKHKAIFKKSLVELHTQHIEEFKGVMLDNLKNIKPETFEHFCKKLLEIYGFKDLRVTNVKKDGGIDGYGKLKVGISYLNVAFQSKRWKNSIVGRTEIDKFRGAIQGDFEQGIFITTSSFSKDALKATTKKGAVPIILIDGSMIVDIMIDKKFGVQIEELPIYINALDEILTEE
jgi:restriction system protein